MRLEWGRYGSRSGRFRGGLGLGLEGGWVGCVCRIHVGGSSGRVC